MSCRSQRLLLVTVSYEGLQIIVLSCRSQLERRSHELHQARMAPPLLSREKGEREREETRTRTSQLEEMLEEMQEKCRGLESQVTSTPDQGSLGVGDP